MLSDQRMAVVRTLQKHGGVIEDEDGFAVAPLIDAIGADPRSFNSLLRSMDAAGQIKREIRGKRTYRIELTWRDEERADQQLEAEGQVEDQVEAEEEAEAEEAEVQPDEVELEDRVGHVVSDLGEQIEGGRQVTAASPALEAADRVEALVDRMLDVVFDIVTENSDRIRDAFLAILQEEESDEPT